MKMVMKWKTRLGALALAGALSLGLAGQSLAAEAEKPTLAEAAQQAAEHAATYGGASAVQYAVWEDGKITLSGHAGVYSRTENRALTDDDLFGVGSVSKVYTTAAVMRLVEAGKVGLDEPVTTYLPGFKMADPRYADITVRMLLNHSSGLMGSSTGSAFLFADPDRTAAEDLLNRLSTQRLKADPGAFSVYCNDGFTLAELVVEAVSGQSFPDYLHQEVLSPMGLKSTFAPGDDFDTGRLVKTYQGGDTRALPQDTLGIVGAGGLYASASDLAAFGGALTGGGLLTAASLDAMAAPEYRNGLWPEDDADSFAYGLGWDNVKFYPFALSGVQALTKGGDTLRYHAGLVVIPEYRLAAAVLSSGGASNYNELAAARMLIDVLAQRGVTVDETAPALPGAAPAAMPAGLLDFAGYYGSSLQQFEVGLSAEGVLTLQSMTAPGLPAQTFSYYSDGSFRDADNTVLVKFVEEKNGQTYLYQKGWGQVPGLTLSAVSNYLAQKLPENKVDPAVQAAWDARNAAGFLPVNEKYTSQIYMALGQAAPYGAPRLAPGYQGGSRIVDADNTEFDLNIPNMGSRDGQEMHVYERDGATYAEQSGVIYADSSVAKPLYSGAGAYATVQADGYARWYTVGDKAAGKTMTVALPEQGGFYVYDATGAAVASSVVYGDTSVVLPAGGMIVFAGAPGARFYLDFTDSQ